MLIKRADKNLQEVIPKVVFIVPYRDRLDKQIFFSTHMIKILEDFSNIHYKIYYIHQNDKREFNRGAMKNIGFLMLKSKYPTYYKYITMVFHDVDVMPYTKSFFNYETKTGEVKHFYGHKFALGGILSIKACDFEKTNGFPNFWSWGYEDNMFKERVLNSKLTINYNQFYPIMDKHIIQLKDNLKRLTNRIEKNRYLNNTTEGFDSITDLNYVINEETGFVDVYNFSTGIMPSSSQNKVEETTKQNVSNNNKRNRMFMI